MEEVVRYECVCHRNRKDFKDRNEKANCWEKQVRNLIYRRRRGGLNKGLKKLPSESGPDAVPFLKADDDFKKHKFACSKISS